ncbi:MAG: hypothetical protein M1275_02615 [Patescibacteria group bacterium]|nr:hypothetical protein [Patescibacteria group bacterium]
MDSFIHADIFFFITSIAVVLVTALLVIALVYLVRILRDAKSVTGKVKEETELISEDINELRTKTKKEGVKFKNFLDFFSGFSGHKSSRRRK